MRERLISELLEPKRLVLFALNATGFMTAMGIYFDYVQQLSPRYGIPVALAVMVICFGAAFILKRVLP